MIELVIAMALAALLFGTVGLWMHQALKLSTKSMSLRRELKRRIAVDSLLQDWFWNVSKVSYEDGKVRPTLFTKKNGSSLILYTRPQISKNPYLNGQIRLELYHNQVDQTLELSYEPSDMRWPNEICTENRKKEVLLTGVQQISFEFLASCLEDFIPSSAQELQREKHEETEERREDWPAFLGQLPMMVRLHLKTKKGDWDWVYVLSQAPVAHQIIDKS